MAQITQLEITFYKGVPFNNKYENVLFVDNVSRETFLNNYKVGQPIVTQKRFEIINETEAFFDITNNYDCFECNYMKVHSILAPETSLTVTERDTFYFVNSVRQITTNTVRLYIEIDVFQTFFNKYDYQNQIQVIPEVKKSRCMTSTDFASAERNAVIDCNLSNQNETRNSLYEQENANYKQVYGVMHFTTQDGEYTAITKYAMALYPASTSFPNGLSTLISSIYSSQQFYINGTFQNIEVLNLYLIPYEMLKTATFTEFATGYYKYTLGGNDVYANFYVSTSSDVTKDVPFVNHSIFKTVTPKIERLTSVGTFTKRIELPYNDKSYTINIIFNFSNNFQCFMNANGQTIEFTDDFELNILQSQYAEYLQQHQNGLAIKTIANVLNLGTSIFGLSKGSGGSIVGLTNTITGTAGEIASLVDLKHQPLKVQGNSNCATNIRSYNGFAIFETRASNTTEIQQAEKYLGYKMNYLTDKTFVYIPNAISNVQYNFDYYKFSNIEIVGEFAETYKSRIEQMFLNGIRLWYRTDNFLQTIENRETITP